MEKLSMTGINNSTKKKARWSKSVEVNGITTSITVKEVENGYVIEQSVYGKDATKKNAEWKDISKTYISKTNPLEGKEADEDEDNDPFTLKGLDTIVID